MFEGFERFDVSVSGGGTIHGVRGGSGPALLLLHGYPQTHIIWHRIAGRLAEQFTVVAADLRGYGASFKPPADGVHANHSKRAMANDMVELMAHFGFDRFMIGSHDRGSRVTHRMCLDHPDKVAKAAVIDIIPTVDMYGQTNAATAKAYWHWFFLIQPAPLPERAILADTDAWIDAKLNSWGTASASIFAPEAIEAYKTAVRDPACVTSMCEDYRAAATIDLEHDAADEDTKITCPLLVLWGRDSVLGKHCDPAASWRKRATDVTAREVSGGHFLPEENPDDVLANFLEIFSR